MDVELLAPAKNLECGLSAIQAGADAIYIAAEKFGAREHAGNSLKDIENLVLTAHRYHVRVYCTINTLLYDHELEQARKLIWQLYHIGTDALIIQDVGLLECSLPPMALIASTQMNNFSKEHIAFLRDTGFKRVILARELSIAEIKDIHENVPGVELEAFVYGALCISMSGRCYLSYALGKRSGNRGQCAQPCRKLYTLTDESGQIIGKKKHWLSIKDLNLSDYFSEMILAGVSSFKIEGRLKDKNYVINTVLGLRRKLDSVLENLELKKSSSGMVETDFVANLSKTFNRGFTEYFFFGRRDSVQSFDTPKMRGEEIGPIIKKQNELYVIDTQKKMCAGDGFNWLDKDDILQGAYVNYVHQNQVILNSKKQLPLGTLLYRNHDHEFLSQLSKIKIKRKIRMSFLIKVLENGFSVKACDEDKIEFECRVVEGVEEIRDSDTNKVQDVITKQLKKTGNSDFKCISVDFDRPFPWFVPVSMINELRRKLLSSLLEKRVKSYQPIEASKLSVAACPQNVPEADGNVLNQKAELFYSKRGVKNISPGMESGINLNGKRLMICRFCLLYELGWCQKQKVKELYLTDENGNKFTLRFDCSRCFMELFL